MIEPGEMKKNPELGTRTVFGINTVIHCHHYNSRIQKTLEETKKIDGKKIFYESAEATFHRMLKNAFSQKSDDQFQLAVELFSYLGFGSLNFSKRDVGVVESRDSHFVEGWKSGYKKMDRPVCTFVEGYLAGTLTAIHGDRYKVKETECRNQGAKTCVFEFEKVDLPPLKDYIKGPENTIGDVTSLVEAVKSKNVDMDGIRNAVFGMPLFGNSEGLIPAFNVYLAHMPKDFYNLVSLGFLDEMDKVGLRAEAQSLLEDDAETCAINTFSGIMNSEEWNALVRPMIKENPDNFFALIAVANALGWGAIQVTEHIPNRTTGIQTINGYEAQGVLEILENNKTGSCPMLSGVASGLMALIYSEGSFEDRKGVFVTKEDCCRGAKSSRCQFVTKLAEEVGSQGVA